MIMCFSHRLKRLIVKIALLLIRMAEIWTRGILAVLVITKIDWKWCFYYGASYFISIIIPIIKYAFETFHTDSTPEPPCSDSSLSINEAVSQ